MPKLSSDQETVLEELIQRSFGAQDFYVPRRYRRKSGSDEPCDLFWSSGGNLVLFYLTAGNKSLHQQDTHNLRQSSKWLRRWASNSALTLEGINRFGDVITERYSAARRMVSISVVSAQAGIVFHPSPHAIKTGFTCTIPDSLIHIIASLNGTMIDLLGILKIYSDNFGSHIVRHTTTGPERLSNALLQLGSRVTTILNRLHDANRVGAKDDLAFVSNLLGMHKLPAPIGEKLMATTVGRKQAVEFFGDMSASDFLLLSVASLRAISATDKQRLSICARTQGMFLDWNIVATSISAKNSPEFIEQFFKSIKGTSNEDLPTIIYGYDIEGADYRGPMMYALPPRRRVTQATSLITAISNRIDPILRARAPHC